MLHLFTQISDCAVFKLKLDENEHAWSKKVSIWQEEKRMKKEEMKIARIFSSCLKTWYKRKTSSSFRDPFVETITSSPTLYLAVRRIWMNINVQHPKKAKENREQHRQEQTSWSDPWKILEGFRKVLRNYPDNVCHGNCCWDYPSYRTRNPSIPVLGSENYDLVEAFHCCCFSTWLSFHHITFKHSSGATTGGETMFHSLSTHFNTIARHTNKRISHSKLLKKEF